MLITQTRFDQLPLLIQQGALYLWGVYITAYRTKNGYQVLYNLSDFYVEVIEEQNRVRISAFTSSKKLRPYLRRPLVAKSELGMGLLIEST
jgi:hypothetical protein